MTNDQANTVAATDGHRRLMAELRAGFPDSPVMAAFEEVPRHLFLPGVSLDEAYSNKAITTAHAAGLATSSCSKPSWVAMVIGLAQVSVGQRVLEIGSGTGYSAAIMSRIVGSAGSVATVDIDQDLVDMTRRNLEAFGFEAEGSIVGCGVGNAESGHAPVVLRKSGFGPIATLCQDGFLPTPGSNLYRAILVTAAGADVAPCWRERLAEGGHLVTPLRILPGFSILVSFEKQRGRLLSRMIGSCSSVRLRGEGADEAGEWAQFQVEAIENPQTGATEQTVVARRHNSLVFTPINRP